jgi:5-methylcytosine-specific restriction endonuclease McrA
VWGCSYDEFKIHIESQFTDDMSWDNYGLKGWHIDHIKPLSGFNLDSQCELKKAWHYTNLQPLWAEDNLKKGSKYD